MNVVRQIVAVVAMNLRSLPQHLGASVVVVIGVAGVVGVLICVLAMGVGFARTVAGTGRSDRVIILASGALNESMSGVPREAVLNIIHVPGIEKDAGGRPIAAAEVLAQIQRPRNGGVKRVNVTIRGVGIAEPLLRPEIHLISGRMFNPGLQELIVGRNAEIEYGGLNMGDRVPFQNGSWLVVGIFDSAVGNIHDSEIMTDADTLRSALKRSWFHSVTARLERPDSFEQVKKSLTDDPSLHVEVHRESEYFAAQSRGSSTLLKFIGYFVGGVMAVGALFGALNTLYAAVSSRAIEIATLRAIGFGAAAVTISVLAEALTLALVGGLLGAVVAWMFFNGHAVSMISGGQNQLAFSLFVTPSLIVVGIAWACLIGFVGGLFPAIRAARLPIATALRDAA